MKKLYFIFYALIAIGVVSCTTSPFKKNLLKENPPVPRDTLKVENEVKLNLFKEGFKAFKNERVIILNVHDFPDSAIISAKSKMNPPDMALGEARLIQQDRAEVLRQSLESHCDNCENIEIVTPLDLLTEKQINFFFDKIFLRQEVTLEEVQNIRKDLAKYSVLVLVLSSENYEKNRGYNKKEQVISESEAELKSEVYIFHLNNNQLLYRANLDLFDTDFIFYEKMSANQTTESAKIKNVSDTKIIRLLNDTKYDDIYPYPLTDESLTLFYFFYNNLMKNISGEQP
jgi:hypothetical protein